MKVGYMAMPNEFRYRDVYLRGKPVIPPRHPAMDPGCRAKIFAPFAALRGFDQAVLSKDTLYTERIQMDEGAMEELNRKLIILLGLTHNGKAARSNRAVAVVTYFVPCVDKNNPAYGIRGQYQTITDVVWNVDSIQKTVLVGKTVVPMRDILTIEAEGLFDERWDLDAP